MKLWGIANGKRFLFGGLFVCLALLAAVSAKYLYAPRILLNLRRLTPQPPLLVEPSNFSCINSPAVVNKKRRVAVLHGQDWTLGSLIEPSCLPEKEFVFSIEGNKRLRPFTGPTRTRLWVTRKRNVTLVKVVEHSGDEASEMIAVGFATNHRCTSRTSKDCSITTSWQGFVCAVEWPPRTVLENR